MILYFWTALSGRSQIPDDASGQPEPAGSSVALGITDDRARAMRAGEEALGAGRASVVIIEAVRPAMAEPSLAPCYLRIGVGWVGRRAGAGEVTWNRFFAAADPGGGPPPGRMGP
jgi:hypothetical protein